jgi:phosphate transport system substrate-binding protein
MRRVTMSRTVLTIIAAVFALVAVFAPIRAGQPITIKGSDTILPLGQRWAEAYMKQNPGVVIQVTGGGSGVGIAALINGSTDICEASRSMKPSEIKNLQKRFNTPGVEIPIAKDGITVYVNDKNKISELSLPQLKAIFTSKITNWKDLGGDDAPIILYGRENSSGTYALFKEEVLKGEDFAAQTQTLPGTAAIVNAVALDANGIGYGGAAYAKGVREVLVKKDDQSKAYAPTLDNVKSGVYPLSRNLFWYLRNKPTGDMQKLVDYVLSDTGQKIVTEVGYFPLK